MMKNDEFDRVVEQYYEKFGEYFPLMEVQGWDDERIIRTIQKYIQKGKPYVSEYRPGIHY